MVVKIGFALLLALPVSGQYTYEDLEEHCVEGDPLFETEDCVYFLNGDAGKTEVTTAAVITATPKDNNKTDTETTGPLIFTGTTIISRLSTTQR